MRVLDSIASHSLRVLKHTYFLPACFFVFLISRLVLILLVPTAEPFSDALWYFARGITLAEEGRYSENGIPTAYWPVGYPAFLSLLFQFGGPSILVAQIGNLVLAAVSFWVLYLFSRRLFSDEIAARGAVLLLTIYPNNAAYVSLLLTEHLYTSLLLVASLALLSKRLSVNVLVSGVAFGLATLVKTQTVLLIPALAFVVFLGEWSVRAIPRAAVRSAAVMCVALLVVAPWTIRNYSVFGTFVLVSTNGGMSLLAGNNPSVVGDYRNDYSSKDPLFDKVRFSVEDQVGANGRASMLAQDWIKSHPYDFLGLIPKKVFRLWAPDGEGEWGFQDTPFYEDHWIWFRVVRIVNQAMYAASLILFVTAIWRLTKTTSGPSVYYGGVVVLVFTIICAVFSGQSRYHFPAMPFILAYAAWVVVGSRTIGLAAKGG